MQLTQENLYYMWYILPNVKIVILECNISHNKHHILYIVMDDSTTKFISQYLSWAVAFLCEKNHILL